MALEDRSNLYEERRQTINDAQKLAFCPTAQHFLLLGPYY